MSRAWIACEAALFGVLAYTVRALPWRRVFDDGSVLFAGNDAFYHARRIAYALHHFPEVLSRDPYLNYPHGGQPIWSPAYDGLNAGIALLLGASDAAAMERVVAWLPPLIGAVGVVAAWWLARQFFGPTAARVAAGLLVALPAHYTYSRVGFADHHVLVATVSVALLAATLGTLRALESGRALVGWAVGLGICLGASLAVWPGMLIHVATAEACLLLLWALSPDRVRSGRVAWTAALVQLPGLAVVAPFALGNDWDRWGAFSPVVLSNFQPWLFGCAFGVFAAVGAVERADRAPTAVWARLGLAAGVAVALSIATLFVSADALDAIATDAWQWFAREEAFQAEVAESRPIFLRGHVVDWLQPALLLTPLFYAVPLLIFLEWRAARSLEVRSVRFALLGWSLVLLGATLMQARFFNSFSIAQCLVLGVFWARWSPRATPGARRFAAAVSLLMVVATCGWFHRGVLSDPTTWGASGEPARPVLEQRRGMLADVADWVARHTPETKGWLDASLQPEYAVMSSWTDGHVLIYRGRRPSVVTNFGDDIGAENFALSEALYTMGEAGASRMLDQLGARYLLVEYRKVRRLRDFGPHSIISRLYFGDGEGAARAVVSRDGELRNARVEVPSMGRYRLVFETPPKPYAGGSTMPGFKLYEHVLGATVEGSAPARAKVDLTLPLRTPTGREFVFRAGTVAAADGRYAFRMPYATSGAPAGVVSAPTGTVASGGRSAPVVVDELAVREGRAVRGPDF